MTDTRIPLPCPHVGLLHKAAGIHDKAGLDAPVTLSLCVVGLRLVKESVLSSTFASLAVTALLLQPRVRVPRV